MTDPFIDAGDGRLYRSGDLGLMRPDGTVEYVGRRDQQVKVRGFRIELAEVERALVDLPMVRDAVAVADRNRGGDLRLLGYVRPASGRPAHERGVRALLAQRLPGHLIPSVVTVVDEWPLTESGRSTVLGCRDRRHRRTARTSRRVTRWRRSSPRSRQTC